MKSRLIWSIDKGYDNYFIDPDEVEERAFYVDDGSHWVIENVLESDLDELEKKLEKVALFQDHATHGYIETLNELDMDEFQNVLVKAGYKGAYVYQLNDYPEFEDQAIVFNRSDCNFGRLDKKTFEPVKILTYWDGNNSQQLIHDGIGTAETQVVLTDESISLDEWDGNNMVTGGIGLHQEVYKIIEMDEEREQDMYLILFSSQWQGELPTVEIVDENDLKEHLKKYDRDVHRYLH